MFQEFQDKTNNIHTGAILDISRTMYSTLGESAAEAFLDITAIVARRTVTLCFFEGAVSD